MSKLHIQLYGLISLSILAGIILFLVAYTFGSAVTHISPDGKVPLADAGMFSALMLSFQQVVQGIRSIWESQERQAMQENLAQSGPALNAPQDAKEAARDVADAADTTATQIEGKKP